MAAVIDRMAQCCIEFADEAESGKFLERQSAEFTVYSLHFRAVAERVIDRATTEEVSRHIERAIFMEYSMVEEDALSSLSSSNRLRVQKNKPRLSNRVGSQVKQVLTDDRIFTTSMAVDRPRAIRELRAQAGRLTAMATLLRTSFRQP